jgi:uncharacterized protein (DUF1330 family)
MIDMLVAILLAGQGSSGTASPLAPPPTLRCDSPVYMVIEGPTLDRARMMAYGQAIAQSGLYEKLGGYYVTIPRPLEVFEGELPPGYANLTVRFPCIKNARAFWNSRVYQEEIIKLRQNPSAGDYTVSVYAEAPMRADMADHVGNNSFTHDFSDPDVPQVDPPVVGPNAVDGAL